MTIPPDWQNLFDNVKPEIYANSVLREKIAKNLKTGNITIQDNPMDHHVVFFLPYNPITKEVFLVFYKNLGNVWLGTGGHIEKNESPKIAAIREIKEELGIDVNVPDYPFFIGLTQVHHNKPGRNCRFHYDFWYLIETDGTNFKLTTEEFSEYKWLKIPKALALVTDISTHQALEKLLSL